MARTETGIRSRSDQRAIPLALIAIVFVLLAARTASHFVKAAPNGDLVHWVSLDAVPPTNKTILLYFTAEACAGCDMLDAEVFGNADLARDINERLVPVRLAGQADLQQRYNVRTFPTLVFVDPSGAERARMEGFRGREEFERVMESVR